MSCCPSTTTNIILYLKCMMGTGPQTGTLYKSTFAVDSTGNDGTFTTTSIA